MARKIRRCISRVRTFLKMLSECRFFYGGPGVIH
jgi:hypothetical protein